MPPIQPVSHVGQKPWQGMFTSAGVMLGWTSCVACSECMQGEPDANLCLLPPWPLLACAGVSSPSPWCQQAHHFGCWVDALGCSPKGLIKKKKETDEDNDTEEDDDKDEDDDDEVDTLAYPDYSAEHVIYHDGVLCKGTLGSRQRSRGPCWQSKMQVGPGVSCQQISGVFW